MCNISIYSKCYGYIACILLQEQNFRQLQRQVHSGFFMELSSCHPHNLGAFFHGVYPSLTRGMGIQHMVMATVSGAALCYNSHVYHLFPTDIATFNEVIELPISEMERLLR
jgi:hypothetical protein